MHGLGNDFAIFDCRDPNNHRFNPSSEQIARYADRKLGIGFDQLVVLKPCLEHDIEMFIYNADGNAAGACGNAARCVGRLLNKESGSILCAGRTLHFVRTEDDQISVNMGTAIINGEFLIHGRNYKVIDVGNLHAVTFVDDLDQIDVAHEGSKVAHSEHFPDSVNVTFAQKTSDSNIIIRTWERGVGPTLACGSAACATAACTNLAAVTIIQQGGQATVKRIANEFHLTGPAVYVYVGRM